MFTGIFTAIVTPFNQDGSVDYGCFEALIERQIAAGITGIVPVGTTGESPTLSTKEHVGVIAAAVKTAAGRVQVVAGTGGNSTDEALELTREALALGVNGTLQVTPYYNKPTDEGLYRHFSAVADLGVPVMLYNVPGRTSREIPIDVVARLAAHPHVVAIKEAAGDVGRVNAIRRVCDLAVLSGDDLLALPMLAVGASGLVSVASNVVPAEMGELVRAALAFNYREAQAIHSRLLPLMMDLFLEVNPIPVKAALADMGLAQEVYRLPLCGMQEPLRAKLRASMRALDLIG